MTPKEQSRLQVLNSLAAEQMTLDQSAELMGVTPRHARRILAVYREHGAAALAHGHRGRRPVNLVAELRLAGATTLEQAQAVLDGFVPSSTGASAFPHNAPSQRSGPWTRSCA